MPPFSFISRSTCIGFLVWERERERERQTSTHEKYSYTNIYTTLIFEPIFLLSKIDELRMYISATLSRKMKSQWSWVIIDYVVFGFLCLASLLPCEYVLYIYIYVYSRRSFLSYYTINYACYNLPVYVFFFLF